MLETPIAPARAARWSRIPLPAAAFAIVGLVLGVTFALVSPPLRWTDENTHLTQVYGLSEGKLAPETRNGGIGIDVPREVFRFILVFAAHHNRRELGVPSWDDMRAARDIRITGERAFAPLAAYTYSVVGYLPQALGVIVARPFTDSVLVQMWAARIANVLCWVALTFAALCITPVLAGPMCVVALAPMSVYLAGTCAADGVTNGLAFLWTACVLRLALDERAAPGPRGWIGLATLAVLVALSKLLYTPLLLLLLIVPHERLGGRRRLLAISGAVMALGAVAVAAWALSSWDQVIARIAHRGDSAMAANLARLRENPLDVATVLWTTNRDTMSRWLWQLADTNWKGPMPPPWLFEVLLVALLVALVADARPRGWPTVADRVVALLAVVVSWVAIGLGAFLLWTSKSGGSPGVVAGLQGRYLLPLVPALLVAVCPPGIRLPSAAKRGATLAAVALNVWLLLHTIQRTLWLYSWPKN